MKSEKWCPSGVELLNCWTVELFDCWMEADGWILTDKLHQAYSPPNKVGRDPTLTGWGWNISGLQPFRVMVMYRVHGVRTQISQMNAVRTVETQIIASLQHIPLSFRTPWGIPRGREKIHRWRSEWQRKYSEWQGRGKGSSCRGKPLYSPVIMPIWTSPFPLFQGRMRNWRLTAVRALKGCVNSAQCVAKRSVGKKEYPLLRRAVSLI